MSKYLAQRFSRITVDFGHMDGQACIRGLPITVSDVAKLATSGKSVAEIIAQYPGLEADDIHQALAYEIELLKEGIVIWVDEGMRSLRSIKDYSEFFEFQLKNKEEFNDEQKLSIQRHISKKAVQARDIWRHLRDWVNIKYGESSQFMTVVQLSAYINIISDDLKKFEPEATLDIQVPENFPHTKSNDNLIFALGYLIEGYIPPFVTPHASLIATQRGASLSIAISRPFDKNFVNSITEDLFWESSPFSVAAYILRQHDSALRTHTSDTHITFEFDLPIWKAAPEKGFMTTHFETITLDLTPPFAYLTLNRPQAKNAMSMQMVADLIAAFESLRENRDIRAVVISGAGGTFCAGGDIKEMAAVFQSDAPPPNSALLDTMLRAVNQAPQIVIAKLQGAAMGGGFGLMCVSDIAVADTSAAFGLPEVRLGLAPALISPFVIARVGLTTARRLMLTGTRFGAEKALEYGLIHEVCAPDELDARVQATLGDIRQCSPNAIAEIKKLIFEVTTQSLDATVDYRANLLDTLRRSDDGIDGMMAFVEKRAAKWAKKDE